MESMESFAARVFQRTGKNLNDLPRRVATTGDAMGHIMCARGNVYICAVGYPYTLVTDNGTTDEGSEYWDDFEVVLIG